MSYLFLFIYFSSVDSHANEGNFHLFSTVYTDNISLQENSAFHYKKMPKQHKCPFCIKKFIRTTDLERHIRVHTGEKPYICHVCNKAYRQKQALKYHFNKIHAGTKEFHC